MSVLINPYKQQHRQAEIEGTQLAYFGNNWLCPADLRVNDFLQSLLCGSITFRAEPVHYFPKPGARDRAIDLAILAQFEAAAIVAMLKE